jgi:hypothetical protein
MDSHVDYVWINQELSVAPVNGNAWLLHRYNSCPTHGVAKLIAPDDSLPVLYLWCLYIFFT